MSINAFLCGSTKPQYMICQRSQYVLLGLLFIIDIFAMVVGGISVLGFIFLLLVGGYALLLVASPCIAIGMLVGTKSCSAWIIRTLLPFPLQFSSNILACCVK